ncbi:hypothetical protein V6Z11_A06G239300 [Gossypium hirsutum]
MKIQINLNHPFFIFLLFPSITHHFRRNPFSNHRKIHLRRRTIGIRFRVTQRQRRIPLDNTGRIRVIIILITVLPFFFFFFFFAFKYHFQRSSDVRFNEQFFETPNYKFRVGFRSDPLLKLRFLTSSMGFRKRENKRDAVKIKRSLREKKL